MGVIEKKVNGLIERIENKKITPWCIAFYVYCISILRGVLEGLLEYHKALPPFFDLFIHFPLWYLNVFLSTILLLWLFTGEKAQKIAKVVFLFTPIIIVVPLIDFFVSSGRGFMLGYAYNWETFLTLLFSFMGLINRSLASPGQSALYIISLFLLVLYAIAKKASKLEITFFALAHYFITMFHCSTKFFITLILQRLTLNIEPKQLFVPYLGAIAVLQLFCLFFIIKREQAKNLSQKRSKK